MVRTKADAARKAGGKASRKTPVLSGRSTSRVSKSGKKGRSGGGNSYCRRPTPAWQVPITKIFKKSDEGSTAIDEAQEVEDGASASTINEPGTSGTSSICHDRSSSSERDEIDSDGDEDANGESDEENNEAESVEDNNEAESAEDNEAEFVKDNNEAKSMDKKEPSTNGKEPLNGHGKHSIESNNMEPSEQIEELNKDAEDPPKDNDKLSDRENGSIKSPDSIQVNQASSIANSSNV